MLKARNTYIEDLSSGLIQITYCPMFCYFLCLKINLQLYWKWVYLASRKTLNCYNEALKCRFCEEHLNLDLAIQIVDSKSLICMRKKCTLIYKPFAFSPLTEHPFFYKTLVRGIVTLTKTNHHDLTTFIFLYSCPCPCSVISKIDPISCRSYLHLGRSMTSLCWESL